MVCRVASRRVGACGGLLEISGIKSGDVYAFVGMSSVVLGPSCLRAGCCGAPLFLPVITLLNYLSNFNFNTA